MQFNIFKGIFDNPIFPIVISVVFILQIILVTFAGSPFGVYNNYGLTIQQWLITVLFYLFRLLLDQVPLSLISYLSCYPAVKLITFMSKVVELEVK